MPSGSSQRTKTIRPDPPPPTRWRVWPMGEGPGRTLLALGALLGVWGLVRWWTGRAHLAVLALAALALALWRFFVPVTFELNAQGVEQTILGFRRRIRWEAVGRYEVAASGVLLLPHADRRPVDAMHGLYLPWGSRREEVLAHVRYHLDPWPEG